MVAERLLQSLEVTNFIMAYQEQYKEELAYIDAYWDLITHQPTRTSVNHHIIDIPHAYITPNDKKFTYIFYWDTYFMSQGLLGTKRARMVGEMVHNFVYIFKRYGLIPNFNAPAGMNRSQPPFLSSMIMDTYASLTAKKGIGQRLLRGRRKQWLANMISVAKKEYTNVWIDLDTIFHHSVKNQRLSRYGDRDIGYAHSSELESGWDFTSRFYNRCDEFLPVDLNVYLYKYEQDFANAAQLLSQHPEKVTYWNERGKQRAGEINKLMWNEEKGFFFDYNYKTLRQSTFWSLAGFIPMWGGIATAAQAEKMINHLPFFETDYGLTITTKESLAPSVNLSDIPIRYRITVEKILAPKQWDWPNVWPPLEYLTVIGLLRYGYVDDAKRIMKKSLAAHAKIFHTHKTFFEKINGALADKPDDYHYPTQDGFGWTNAIFYRYTTLLDAMDANQSLFDGSNPHDQLWHFYLTQSYSA